MKTRTRVIAATGIIIILCAIFYFVAKVYRHSPWEVSKQEVESENVDHYAIMVENFGQPDSLLSTEYDIPRPPIPSRIAYYIPENVYFAFLPDAKIGNSPPYSKWILIGAVDIKTKEVLTIDQTNKKLQGRKGNKRR